MRRDLVTAVAAAALWGCASAPAAPDPPEPPPSDRGTIRVQGHLTAEGVECPAMRSEDGTLYTLLGDLKGFKAGERVVVEGTRVEISFCMQGTTLDVKQITRRP